jgi:hypothetical protein
MGMLHSITGPRAGPRVILRIAVSLRRPEIPRPGRQATDFPQRSHGKPAHNPQKNLSSPKRIFAKKPERIFNKIFRRIFAKHPVKRPSESHIYMYTTPHGSGARADPGIRAARKYRIVDPRPMNAARSNPADRYPLGAPQRLSAAPVDSVRRRVGCTPLSGASG